MSPKVSVVVTCYNYGQFVTECLKSLKEQTFTDFEVIIIDDGSTDNSADQIKPFLQDDRFHYIWQKNGGQANAKNRGIKESKGDLIAFLDADDIWLPQKLEKQVPLFDNKKVGVTYSAVSNIDPDSNLLSNDTLGPYLQLRRGRVTDYLIYDNFIPFSSAIVLRECFTKHGAFDESLPMGIDWDLWLRFSTDFQFEYNPETALYYRVGHSGQMSKNLPERIRCADRIIEKFKKQFPEHLSAQVEREAKYYSFCTRGYAYRQYTIWYSFKYFFRAILLFPLRKNAYLGFLKVPLQALFNR